MRRAAAAAAAAQAQAQQQHQQITHTSRCRQSFMLRAWAGKETETETGVGALPEWKTSSCQLYKYSQAQKAGNRVAKQELEAATHATCSRQHAACNMRYEATRLPNADKTHLG